MTRLFFSAETLACLLLAYPFRRWLNSSGLTVERSISLDLMFILLLIAAVFFSGELIRRALGLRSLFRDRGE